MLVFSEEHLLPTDVNVLTIAGRDGNGYFYIHRLLYDQAVILDDLYSENPYELIKAVTGGYTSRGDVVTFLRDMPKPINILGPFLMLVTEPIDNLIDMVGAIHVMSSTMNFRAMLKIPFAMRHQNPKFSLGIRDEYRLSWDMFTHKTLPYNANMLNQMAYGVPMQAIQPVQDSDQVTIQNTSGSREDAEDMIEEELSEDEKNQQVVASADNLEDALTGLMNMSEDYWNNLFDAPTDNEEEAAESTDEQPKQQWIIESAPELEVSTEPVEEQSKDGEPPTDIVGALLSKV